MAVRTKVLAPLAALALSWAGCAESPEIPGDPQAATAGAGVRADAPVHVATHRSSLSSLSALDRLPADTVLVAAIPSIATFAEQIGWDRLVASHSKLFEEVRTELRRTLGIDRLDPAVLADLGIDPDGALGVAWVDVARPVGVLVFDLVDEARFDAALNALAQANRQALVTTTLGDAVIVHADEQEPDLVVVRRDGHVYAAASSDDGRVLDVARRIALVAPEGTLPRSARFRSTVDQLALGEDGGLYFDVGALATFGADELRAGAGGEEEDPRRDAAASLLDATFGGVTGFAAGVRFGPGGVSLEAVVGLHDGALLRHLGRNREAASPLVRGLASAPRMLLEGRLDVPTLRTLAELMAASLDADLEKGLSWLAGIVGVEDPLALLSGELGFALTDPPAGDEKRGIGWTVAAGVTDEGTARAVLTRVSVLAAISDVVSVDPATGDLRFTPPYDRPFVVGVAGSAIVATSDPAVLARLRGERGALALSDDPRVARTLAAPEGTAGTWLFDARIFDRMLDRVDGIDQAEPAEPEPADPRIRGKRAELRALDRRIREMEQARDRVHATAGRALTRAAGTTLIDVQMTDFGVRLTGLQAFGASDVAAWVEEMARQVDALEAADRDSEALGPLYQQRWELGRELDELQRAAP